MAGEAYITANRALDRDLEPHLPMASLDRLSLQKRLDEIGRTRAEAPAK